MSKGRAKRLGRGLDPRHGRMAVHFSTGKDDWATPDTFFRLVNDHFHFTLDAAAAPDTAKVARYYTVEDDGLAQSWAGERVWVNCPYGHGVTGAWVQKGYLEAQKGALVVMLVPARPGAEWFQDYAALGEVFLLRGRLRFQGATQDAPFDSALIVFWPPGHPHRVEGRIACWDWQAAYFERYGEWPAKGERVDR